MSRTRRTRTYALLCTLLFTLFVLVGCTDDKKDNAVVATYQGGEVTQQELDKQYHFQRTLLAPQYPDTDDYRRQFLDEYITLHKVMLAKAKEEGFKVDEAKIPDAVKEYKQQVTEIVYTGDANKFAEQMKKYGVTDEDIKQYVVADEILRQYRASKVGKVETPDPEVAQYFEKNASSFATGDVWHILVKTEDEAKKAKERLGKGEDFEAVAKELSQDPTAQQNGGKMTSVQFGLFVGPFRDSAATLPLKTYSDPVQTEYGWHIIRVEKRTVPKLADVKNEVAQKLRTEKENAAWDKIYEDVHSKANIQITMK